MASATNVTAKKIWRRAVELAPSDGFRELVCVVFILSLATTMLFRVFRGDWPVGHDHPIHLFRIWQLRETLVHHFSLWTWSHRWFAGYPENVIYPIGADLFVLAVQALSFGMLSVGQAYGVAFWLFYFLFGYAVFFFVSRAVQSRAAGLIAVVFALTDPGNNDIGGWFYVVDIGVWTSAFGMVPALIGTVRVAALLEKPNPRTAAAIGVCVGLALLCHPIHLLYLGIAIPLLCLSRYLSGEQTAWRPALLLLSAGVAAGFLIASFWLVPYLAAVPYALEMGSVGRNFSQIGDAIAAGNLFPRMHPLAISFGLVGAICLLRARRTLPLFMALFIFAIVVGTNAGFAALFGKTVAAWLGKHIIAERLLMLVKPFWYGAGAFLLVSSWRAVTEFLNRPEDDSPPDATPPHPWIRQLLLVGFVSLFVGPVLLQALAVFFHNEVRRPTIWESERQDLKAREEFVAWAGQEIKGPGFFRIAHGFDWDDHDLTDLGIRLPYPFYKVWPTPTGHFKYNIDSGSAQALRATNVRFALMKHPFKDRADFRLLKIFDQHLWLYEFRDWQPLPFEINGTGAVQVVAFGDEEIVLRADDKAHGLLRLNVSYFPKWHATRDNVPVPITAVALPGVKNSGFMQTELAPGTYRFRFERSCTDYVGTVFCFMGIALCLTLANWERWQGWRTRRNESSAAAPRRPVV